MSPFAMTRDRAPGLVPPYALFLEKGAKGGSGAAGGKNIYRRIGGRRGKSILVKQAGHRVLAPRPFMFPALDKAVASGLPERIRQAVVSGMKLAKP